MPPLPTLLAQALVAFTIELDNEFERRLPHRTTSHGSTGHGPWLVSLVMWSNCMRFVDDEGLTILELERLARTGTNLDGMRRWGYVTIETSPTDRRPARPRPGAMIRATPFGLQARETWRPLFDEVERRWQDRFGSTEVARLRAALTATASGLRGGLPDCMPILGHGLFSRVPETGDGATTGDLAAELPLPALLSRVLVAFAGEFEGASDLSLAISANVLRALGERATPIRDLPRLTGVSKEAVGMTLNILEPKGFAVVEPDPAGGRFKLARLTPEGQAAQAASRRLRDEIEDRWQARELRESLEPLAGEPSPLLRGLEPYPDGWRTSVRRPDTLPHFPMVLHRGGFPDGS